MHTQRRQVLRAGIGLGLCTALPAAATGQLSPSREKHPAAPEKLDSADWQQIRRLFSFDRQAPLNAANLCPAFDRVLDHQQRFTQTLNRDVSMVHRRDFVLEQVQSARRQCADILGVSDPNDLAFVRNTTEANAVIVNGLDLKADEEVLLWEQNHATNYQSWHYRHLRQPFICRRLSLSAQPGKADELVQAFLQQLTPKTRVVSFSHLSNISGLRLPAAAICRAIHEYNPDIFIHIDGAQSWGSMPVNLEAIGCDSYSASGHKWLCGPRGSGVLMVRKKWARRIHPLINGYNFTYDYPQEGLPDNALRFENIGQRDTAVYAALGEAVALHRQIGIERIEGRIRELTRHGLEAFDNAGIPTLTPKDSPFGHGVLVADLGNRWKAYGAFLALHNAGIAAAFVHGNEVHCTPGGLKKDTKVPVYLRICPHIYNSTEDIAQAVAIAARIYKSSLQILKEGLDFIL